MNRDSEIFNYKHVWQEYFNYDYSFEFENLIAYVSDRMIDLKDVDELKKEFNSWDLEEEISNLSANEEWTMIKHYCSPETANYYESKDNFIEDMCNIANEIRKEKLEEKLIELDSSKSNDMEMGE